MKKKMIAPAIVTCSVIIYYILLMLLIIKVPGYMGFKIIFALASLFLSGVMLCVFRERIKEIKEGEKDDLSEY